MGTVTKFRLTRKAILRAAKREVERMYRLSAGGQDPIASSESRELFELGLVEEVEWLDWSTYCTGVLNRLYEAENCGE
ncbi:MAG: hypothetical protein FJ134_04470 [Deltaproteobacteria bacterium]|nr:hypothetical protein [Deltaproteobacteria bacterium]